MSRRLLLGVGALIVLCPVLYAVWLSRQPDKLLSDLSRKTGLHVTARHSSTHLPYRLTFEDLQIAPPSDKSDGVSLLVDHAVLSQGLHSTLIRFWGVTFKSNNPIKNLLLSVFDVSHGSVSLQERTNKVILKKIIMDDGGLHLRGNGVLRETVSKKSLRFDIHFSLESKGNLKSFLGPGEQKGRFWGDKRTSHLMIGERSVF